LQYFVKYHVNAMFHSLVIDNNVSFTDLTIFTIAGDLGCQRFSNVTA